MGQLSIAADMKRLDLLNLEGAIRALEAQGADELHFDVADGRFVSRFGFAPEVIAAAKAMTSLPCHAHLLLEAPDRLLPAILQCGADVVTLHAESCTHIHRALSLIRDSGSQAGVALLPATSLLRVNYLLPLVSRLLVLGTDPVARTSGLPRAAFERIRILHENIRYHEYAIALEVEGPMCIEDAARCVRFGASRLVVGPAEADGLGDPAQEGAIRGYTEQVNAAVHVV